MLLLFTAIALFFATSHQAQSIGNQIDAIFEKQYPAGEPGATVLIAKDGKVLYRNAFGMANLELQVPMRPDHVFEIGSITKQFTAVAILMLMEQGKLSLQDPLSKYISDYPKGDEITIHHLLNHTSGVKSYTNMPSFMNQAPLDKTPMELINVFRNVPLEFEPGEDFAYNNSGYILLGYIIEEVAKMSYEDFIQKNVFTPLGMKNSSYGSKTKLIPNRASGYQPITEGTYRNADYLSMTLPYAAGSLMSTVDDMLLWNQAVHNNTLISEKSKQLAFTNYTTNNGKLIYYGYGWQPNEISGSPTVEHGGGIFGYTTSGIYLPKENMYTIVLTNTTGKSPETVSLQATAIVLGKPIKDKPATKLPESTMQQWVGAYQFDNVVRFITYKDGNLYSQREGGQALKLITVSENEYQFEDSFTNYVFTKENGKRIANFADRIVKSKGVETEYTPKPKKESIAVAKEILNTYTGTYELQAGFVADVTIESDQIFVQLTGQPRFEIFAETPETFFIKVVEAKITFNKDTAGKVKGFTLYQGGQVIEAAKIK